MDRLSLKSRLSLNSSPLHSNGTIFPTVIEEPHLSFNSDKDSNGEDQDHFEDVLQHKETTFASQSKFLGWMFA